MKIFITVAMTYLVATTFLCGPRCLAETDPQPAEQIQLIAAGSGVNLGVTRLLTKAFTAQNPHISIDVPGSIGTRGAIKAVSEGAIALGLISRPLKEEEKALGLAVRPYARTAIIIGVNSRVKDESITTQELIEIFKGTRAKWADGNQIIVQAREKSDSGFLVLENSLPGFKEAYAESQEAKRWTLYFNDQDANQALDTVPFAIGVTDLGMIATEKLSIKALQLNGVIPTIENVQEGTYPLSRQLFFVYRESSLQPEVKAFFEFVASPLGNDILRSNGYIPIQ